MSSSESEDNIQVQIRERDNDVDEYVKPALLKEYEEEVERENAELSSDEEEEEEEEETTDESDVEEDETAALLTPNIDTQIFKTIAAIKAKDPSVYDSSKKFFTDEQFQASKKKWEETQSKLKQQGKKMTLKDFERQMLLEHGGYIDEDNDQQVEEEKDLTHVEEQAQIKKAFQMAAENDQSDDDNDEDGDSFLVKRDKTKSELEDEEDDYRKFLLENLKEDETSANVFKEWDNLKDNSNVNPDDAFLMNYVLNRGWVDKKGKTNPTYNEIIDKDEDEQYLDNVDRFESKYNFRYEEGDSAQIITHARDIPGSVRRKESKRKRERERKKAKKQALKEQKLEEIKRLKNEKRKEIHDRLLEIQKITGTGVTGFDNIDLEGDFDPEKYDEQMAKMFDENYYANQDNDNEKPVFDDDLDDKDFDYDNNDADEDIMMDADYLPGGEKYEEQQQNKKKKDKGKGKEKTDSFKDNGNIKDKEYDKLMDEYYSLDFEDVIGGDLATRYKYIQTEPEDFGMTPEEILLADDRELNKVISIKSLAP
ncbi:KRI1-like family-domain-containing protein [Cunninghamella echinulata]|nr:KRI1-like family-domain-containing protein [Cunninghamella echinulata]